jgi:hypothetical protein
VGKLPVSLGGEDGRMGKERRPDVAEQRINFPERDEV